MLKKYGHLLATSISSSLCVSLLWPDWRGHTGTGGCLIWPDKSIPHSCTETALVKLTDLTFWLWQNRCVNWGWRTSPRNMNAAWSWMWPLQPAASRCWEWLALFHVADMRQLQAGVIANFHMAKLLVWKGHQKEKIKKFRTMWKEKETAIWSRSGFRGAAGPSPSLAPAADFDPDPFPCSQLLTTSSALQAALFVCYHCHTVLQVLWLFCSFSALHGSFLLWAEEHLDANVKPEVLTHHGCWLKENWINKKKEMWDRRAPTNYKIHFPSPSNSWDFLLASPRNLWH